MMPAPIARRGRYCRSSSGTFLAPRTISDRTVSRWSCAKPAVGAHPGERVSVGDDLQVLREVVERRARPVVRGDVVNAFVGGDIKDVGRKDVLFDGHPAQTHLGCSVEAMTHQYDLVPQFFVALTSNPAEQRVLAAARRVADPAPDHGVVRPVVDAVE